LETPPEEEESPSILSSLYHFLRGRGEPSLVSSLVFRLLQTTFPSTRGHSHTLRDFFRVGTLVRPRGPSSGEYRGGSGILRHIGSVGRDHRRSRERLGRRDVLTPIRGTRSTARGKCCLGLVTLIRLSIILSFPLQLHRQAGAIGEVVAMTVAHEAQRGSGDARAGVRRGIPSRWLCTN
jgi:hypothetical protein